MINNKHTVWRLQKFRRCPAAGEQKIGVAAHSHYVGWVVSSVFHPCRMTGWASFLSCCSRKLSLW